MHPEKQHKAVLIGEFLFYFISLYYFFFSFFFFVFQNQLLVCLGVLGFCLLTPNSLRTCIQNYVGDVTDMVWGASWNLGQRIINAWSLTLACNTW